MAKILLRDQLLRIKTADLSRVETSLDSFRAYDLRHLIGARWLRASSQNYCSFCIRSGENPNNTQNTIGWVSSTDLVHVFRHNDMLVFRDMIAGLLNPKVVSCFILPRDIRVSWPGAERVDGKRLNDLVPREGQGVFVPMSCS